MAPGGPPPGHQPERFAQPPVAGAANAPDSLCLAAVENRDPIRAATPFGLQSGAAAVGLVGPPVRFSETGQYRPGQVVPRPDGWPRIDKGRPLDDDVSLVVLDWTG